MKFKKRKERTTQGGGGSLFKKYCQLCTVLSSFPGPVPVYFIFFVPIFLLLLIFTGGSFKIVDQALTISSDFKCHLPHFLI